MSDLDLSTLAARAYEKAHSDAGDHVRPFMEKYRDSLKAEELIKGYQAKHPGCSADVYVTNAATTLWLDAMKAERKQWRNDAKASERCWGIRNSSL